MFFMLQLCGEIRVYVPARSIPARKGAKVTLRRGRVTIRRRRRRRRAHPGGKMKFSTVCLLAIIALVPFGLAFLLSPEMTGQLYEMSGWTSATTLVGRLFGIQLLYAAAANLAVMHTDDLAVQRRFATLFCVLSVVATVVSALGAMEPGNSPRLWTTVALYGFFIFAWGWVAFGRGDRVLPAQAAV
jgi:hypothetical protein